MQNTGEDGIYKINDPMFDTQNDMKMKKIPSCANIGVISLQCMSQSEIPLSFNGIYKVERLQQLYKCR